MELIPFIERERASIDSAEIFSNTFDFIRDSLHYFQYPPQRDWKAVHDSLVLTVPCAPENSMGMWLYEDNVLCNSYWKLKDEIENGGRCIYQLRLHFDKTNGGFELYILGDPVPYNIYFFNQRITSMFYEDCYCLQSFDDSVIAGDYPFEKSIFAICSDHAVLEISRKLTVKVGLSEDTIMTSSKGWPNQALPT